MATVNGFIEKLNNCLTLASEMQKMIFSFRDYIVNEKIRLES